MEYREPRHSHYTTTRTLSSLANEGLLGRKQLLPYGHWTREKEI